MIFQNDRISARQLYRMLVLSSLGTSCLFGTDLSIRFGGVDGCWCIVTAAGLSYGYAKIFFNRETRSQEREQSKGIQRLAGLKAVVILLFGLGMMLTLLRRELLRDMGYTTVLMLLLLIIFYAGGLRLEAGARFAQCIWYFMMAPIGLSVCLGIYGIKQERLFSSSAHAHSVFTTLTQGRVQEAGDQISGILTGGLLLFLLFAPLQGLRQKTKGIPADKAYRAVKAAIGTVFLFDLLFYVVILGNLGIRLAEQSEYALIRTEKIVRLPYLSFERQGDLLILFFLISFYFYLFGQIRQCRDCFKTVFQEWKGMLLFGTALYLGVFLVIDTVPYFRSVRIPPEKRVETKYRIYADFMMIDYQPETHLYEVALSLPRKDGDMTLSTYKMEELKELKKINGISCDRKLDLSHVRILVLGQPVFDRPSVFQEVLDYVQEERELSDRVNVCATRQTAQEFSKSLEGLSTEPGLYITNMIENNLRGEKTGFLDLLLLENKTIRKSRISWFTADQGVIRYEKTTELTTSTAKTDD